MSRASLSRTAFEPAINRDLFHGPDVEYRDVRLCQSRKFAAEAEKVSSPASGLLSQIMTTFSGSLKFSGLRRTALTTLNIAVDDPIASPSAMIATNVTDGLWHNVRTRIEDPD
jgi:hypothetical protein